MNYIDSFNDGLFFVLDNLSPKKPVITKGFSRYKKALASDYKKIEKDYSVCIKKVINEQKKRS